jgi:hypothetical protein
MEQRKNYFKKLNLGLIRLINSLGRLRDAFRTLDWEEIKLELGSIV